MKLTKVQETRLLNVAKALRDAHAARKKFTMEKFVFGQQDQISSGDYNYETGEYGPACNQEENFCGTPACALGHYAARTDLQRLLKVVVQKDYRGAKFASLAFFGTEADGDDNCPQYDDEKFEQHFGLDYHEMEELFGGDGCGNARTALQAAKYIERFVKQKQFPGRSNTTDTW